MKLISILLTLLMLVGCNKKDRITVAEIWIEASMKDNFLFEVYDDKTIKVINRLKVDGVKIHNLYISNNSPILKLWGKGEIKEMSVDDYLEKLEYIITHLNKDIIIHRLCADAPKDNLVAPQWNSHKKYILNGIIKLMKQKETYQGKDYNG